jgi:Predicted membrane protein
MNLLMSIFTVAVLAAAPVSELRAAIPIGIHSFGLHPALVVTVAIIGNMIPAVLIIYFLEPFIRWLGKYIPFIHKFFDKWLVRAREKVRPQIDKYGIPGLVIFIGIPLPMTGVWTGAAGAVLLGFSKKNALLASFGGVVMAAVIVLVLDLGLASVFKFFR